MSRSIKRILLHAMKAIGLFRLARAVTASRVRILCYHGISLDDEHEFRPTLFMTPQTFRARLDRLLALKYPVITFDEACRAVQLGGQTACAVAITIDDGWYGTYKEMFPALRERDLPATLYLATYFVEHQQQVFGVALRYVIWKAGRKNVRLGGEASPIQGTFDLNSESECEDLARAVECVAESLESSKSRQALLRTVAEALGVDWRGMEENRSCAFVSKTEAREMAAGGVTLELHTHRHRFPATSFEESRKEIEDNRKVIAEITERPSRHFCFPSGEYQPEQIDWLPAFGIVSATTTAPGLNGRGDRVTELRRLLDSEGNSMIEFEAQLAGVPWLLSQLRDVLNCRPFSVR